MSEAQAAASRANLAAGRNSAAQRRGGQKGGRAAVASGQLAAARASTTPEQRSEWAARAWTPEARARRAEARRVHHKADFIATAPADSVARVIPEFKPKAAEPDRFTFEHGDVFDPKNKYRRKKITGFNTGRSTGTSAKVSTIHTATPEGANRV